MSNKRVALVLSSGGARGISQIGVIEELLRRGYNINSVAGSSIGAMIGGVYASGNLTEFKDWLLGLSKREVIKLMDFSLNRKGFLKADKVFKKMSQFTKHVNIEDLPIRFVAVATDLYNNREMCFTEGSLNKAIRASVAIPVFIQPGVSDNAVLVDGGVMNPLPLNHIIRNDSEKIFAINVNDLSRDNLLFNSPLKKYISKKPSLRDLGLFDIMNMTYELTISQLVNYSILMNKPDLVINIPRNCATTFEFYSAQKLIEIGEYMAKKYMDEYERRI